jgi:hypothetical protein
VGLVGIYGQWIALFGFHVATLFHFVIVGVELYVMNFER